MPRPASHWPCLLALALGSACDGASGPAADVVADTALADTSGPGTDGSATDGADPTPDAADTTADAHDAPDTTPDPADAADAADATPDSADATDTTVRPDLSACQGEVVALALAGQLPYTIVNVGPNAGHFLVDWGTTGSAIDPAGFTPGAPTPVPGTSDRWAGFVFFGPWAEVRLSPQDFSAFADPVRQAGILGTDFLSLNAFVVDWGAQILARAAPGAGCNDAAYRAAGFAPLSTAGYFDKDLSKLLPGVPNVPTVPVRLGAATAPAQIDTGYDDALVGPAMNVNRAFFDAIDPAALVRAPALDLVLTTCVPGVVEPVRAHTLAPGVAVELVAEDGHAARRVADAVVFLKETPAAASACGGIGTWSTPAAQLGVSFVADTGRAVFDPEHARVWLPAAP